MTDALEPIGGSIPYTVTNGDGATISFSSDGGDTWVSRNPEFFTEGTYTVYVKVEKPGCETIIDSGTITVYDLTPTGECVGVVPAQDVVIYDGNTHYASAAIAWEDAGLLSSFIQYSADRSHWSANPPGFTEVGDHTFYAMGVGEVSDGDYCYGGIHGGSLKIVSLPSREDN